ncbi:hypothetical protein AMJ49_05370 [Parcubacteria bacterium DG_74_2]|nr:MAG: hypothetical protein AMJ49_05370 [Parcubacteria bacterium DG_74_2]
MFGLFIVVNIFSFTRPFSEGGQLYFGKFFLIGLIFVLTAVGILTKRKKIWVAKDTRSIFLFFGVWILFMMISLFHGSYPVSGGLLVFSYVILFLLAFVILPNYIDEKYKWLGYKKTFFWFVFIAIIISVLWGFSNPDSWYTVEKYQSLFINPNFLGFFGFFGVIVSTATSLLSQKRRYLFFIPLYLAIIYFCGSRASLFGVAIFGIVLFCLWLYQKIKVREEKMFFNILIFILLLSFFLGSVFMVYTYWEHFYDPAHGINKFFSLRLFYWTQALSDLNSYDWFLGQGMGKEGFGTVSYDNFYFNILIQTGILGLLALIVFLLTVFYYLFRIFNSLNENYLRRATAISLAMFVAMCTCSLFESWLFSLGNLGSIYLWTNLGLCLNHMKEKG